PIDEAGLVGLACVAGLDLSRRDDWTALVLLFAELIESGLYRFHVKPYFWVPRAAALEQQRVTGKPIEKWAELGLVTLVDTPTIDYHLILDKLKELSPIYRIREVAFDEWQAEYLIQDIERMGF